MGTTIVHNTAASRYEIYLDETLAGYADYYEADGVRDFSHTMTFPEFRGRGVAGQVVEFALNDTRDAGCTIIPTCWYVAEYLGKHPEYAALTAG